MKKIFAFALALVMVLSVAAFTASAESYEETVVATNWQLGYVGSSTNTSGFVNVLNPNGGSYSYSDVIDMGPAGSTITFADDTSAYASAAAYVISFWTKNGDSYEFYAVDGVYFEVADGDVYEGDLEMALIPDGFRTAVLNESLDSKNVMFEGANDAKVHFALLFEFTGDANAIRHVLYNCTASENTIEGQTKGENVEVQTDTLTITAKPLPNGGPVKARTGGTTDSTTYNGWYSSVYEFTAAQSGG